MEPEKRKELSASYDRVAAEYEARIYDELRHKPLDCALLDRFADRVRAVGSACDLGCGPGHVGRYLADRDLAVCGVDLSAAMLRSAKRLNPGMPLLQGDMLALGVADGAWGGIAAFYSVIHVARPEVPCALTELKRVLRPGGLLLLAFHIGDEVLHLDEWMGRPVSVDFSFFRPEEMRNDLLGAGFVVEDVITREPYPDVEAPTPRAYIFAVKPERG